MNDRIKEQVIEAAEQIADLIVKGYTVELSRSRSGLKIYTAKKEHLVLNHQ